MEGSIFSTLTSNELGIFFTGLGVALSAILSGIGSAIGVGTVSYTHPTLPTN